MSPPESVSGGGGEEEEEEEEEEEFDEGEEEAGSDIDDCQQQHHQYHQYQQPTAATAISATSLTTPALSSVIIPSNPRMEPAESYAPATPESYFSSSSYSSDEEDLFDSYPPNIAILSNTTTEAIVPELIHFHKQQQHQQQPQEMSVVSAPFEEHGESTFLPGVYVSGEWEVLSTQILSAIPHGGFTDSPVFGF